MKKFLKFYATIFLIVFSFSFLGVLHSIAADPVACDSCESDNNCRINTTKLVCVDKQCQEPGKTTFCSFSSNKKVEDLIDKVSSWMLVVALIAVPLAILFGAFYILTAAGDTSRMVKGRTIIVWALIALAIFLFVKAFVSILRYFIGF